MQNFEPVKVLSASPVIIRSQCKASNSRRLLPKHLPKWLGVAASFLTKSQVLAVTIVLEGPRQSPSSREELSGRSVCKTRRSLSFHTPASSRCVMYVDGLPVRIISVSTTISTARLFR